MAVLNKKFLNVTTGAWEAIIQTQTEEKNIINPTTIGLRNLILPETHFSKPNPAMMDNEKLNKNIALLGDDDEIKGILKE